MDRLPAHDGRPAMTGDGPAPAWLTVRQAAQRAQCGVRVVYRAANSGALRAARIGGRRDLRIRPEWIDEWLDATAAPVEVRR